MSRPKAGNLSLFEGERSPQSGRPKPRVYRVAQVNRAVRLLLEDRYQNVWIEGELSDVTRAASGHVYFTLNDEEENAQLRGVMFRSDAQRARAKLEDGARVRLRGTVSLFEPRGSYQLIARVALPSGQGDLYARFEAVRRKLEAEGLLDPERKRPLPRFPRVIGVVTSEHGAALHDVIRVAQARCPVRIIVSPCLVQGPEAPDSIAAAVALLARVQELDVMIVGRGGGASEDLFAFNDERVARSLSACPVPVVSAVGHEVDVTIADLVADVRAATPSNAAELVVPERSALLSELTHRRRALQRAIRMRLDRQRLGLDRLARELSDPRTTVMAKRQRLEALRAALRETGQGSLSNRRRRVDALRQRISARDPRLLLSARRSRLAQLHARLSKTADKQLSDRKTRLSAVAARLSAMSPLSVLSRGYAIALHGPSGKALTRAEEAAPGDPLTLRLHQGSLTARVETVSPATAPPGTGGDGSSNRDSQKD